MLEFLTQEQIDQLTDRLRTILQVRQSAVMQPRVGIILGSGLGPVAEAVENAIEIEFDQLPGWPISTVAGHSGKLIIGELENQAVLVMQGRVHYYEGYSMSLVTLPVRVMQRLGVEFLFVTNAAGAVNPEFIPGDLMLIKDHLNLMGMGGLSPLRGPNMDEMGPRFPDMSRAYDRQLSDLARQVAADHNFPLREGVYAGLAGPSFETPADLRFLSIIGTDAVGMSTVPEVTVARHAGTRVLGISGISNKANLDGETLTTHEEVLQAGKILAPRMEVILRGVLRRL